jgi:hypothetical protein
VAACVLPWIGLHCYFGDLFEYQGYYFGFHWGSCCDGIWLYVSA